MVWSNSSFSVLNNLRICFDDSLSKFAQGSSVKRIFGLFTIALAMATPSYFEVIDAEKVVLKVNNSKNPAQILAMTKIWDVKLAKEIRAIFEEMWSEAKPIELT